MTNRFAVPLVLALALAIAGAPAAAQGFGVGARAGTLGIGAEAAVDLTNRLVVRGGVGWTPIEPEISLSEIDVKAEFPTWFNAGLDLYLAGPFRIGAGLLFKSDDPKLSATFTENQEIGGEEFTPQEIGTLLGVIDSRNQVPYALIGFGKHTARGIGLFVDFGVAFLGEPDFRLDAEGGSLSADSGPLRDALDTEAQEFEDDAGAYLKFWPILNLGLRIGV